MAFLEDAERQILLDRYFDIEWCDDVSDLRCVQCHRVAISHCVSSCQHIFCKTCSKFYSDEEHQLKCPQCQEHITQPDFKDFDVEIKIHQLKIFCPNKKYGCKHSDQLRKIPSHLLTCTDTREAALLKKAPVAVQLPSLNGAIGEFKKMTREMNNKVEEKLNELQTNIDRKFNQFERKTDEINKEVKAVRANMDKKVKMLTTKTTGVDKKVKGMELASKKSTEQFQSMISLLESINQRVDMIKSLHQQTSSNMDEMRSEMASMTQEIKAIKHQNSERSNIQKAETYEWTITDVMKNILADGKPFVSDLFTFKGYKYVIKAKLKEWVVGIMAISLQFKDGNAINQLVNKNGCPKVTYIIRDQGNIEKKKDIIRKADLSFYDSFTNPNWIFRELLSNAILSPPYTKDDSMKITMVFEPPSIDRDFVSYTGVLNWRVDNYKKRKEQRFYAEIWSPSFYTSHGGYRIKTQLLINNFQQMRLGVDFLTGLNDEWLSTDFPHKTTVTLINQMDPSKNLVKSEQYDDTSFYAIQLGSIKLIEKNGFIREDSLILKVVIERRDVSEGSDSG